MPLAWIILVGSTVVQIAVYVFLFRRLAAYRVGSDREKALDVTKIGVSVIFRCPFAAILSGVFSVYFFR